MILTPGPVEITDSVMKASSLHLTHRSKRFREIVRNSLNILGELSGSISPVITTGSGTLAVESMIWSFINPGERVIAVTYGEFGNRAITSLERRGAVPIPIRKEADEGLRYSDIEGLVERQKPSSILMIQNETGNGTSIRNLKDIATKSKELGLKVLVDSVSAFACAETGLEKWGIDCIAACGHKGIAAVTGIAVNLLSQDATKMFVTKSGLPHYLDLEVSLHHMDRDETPYTPAVGAFAGFEQALVELQSEGIANRIQRTSSLCDYARSKLRDRGYEVTGTEETRSASVIKMMSKGTARAVVTGLYDAGIQVGSGMKEYAGNAIRIGVMGNVGREQIDNFLATLGRVESQLERER